ncbi:hypothetical protein GOODEAATRI_009457 [Goodea atripinnis]|uniref:Uncharacterized protein n=1 Tax=Goodea atripinnis TaxID=208336 RepID=A0ABV0NWK2_9TELE
MIIYYVDIIVCSLGQIENMNFKITEIQSKFEKAHLKRVKISAEAMLSVLLGSKNKESFYYKATLKTVKKEEEKVNMVFNNLNIVGYFPQIIFSYLCFCPWCFVLQQKEVFTDWRKNVEAMSGMEDRKKLFDASGN